MSRSSLPTKKIIIALCYFVTIALSIKSLREPDLWWQIRTGQWILQHHEVPHQDMFSYTFNGAPWINIKWGFEVFAAIVTNLFGPESVFILQVIVSCLILFFLLKLSGLFFQGISTAEESANKNAHLFSAALAFIVTFISIEYRMIGRPEMISHLMIIIFLFILEKNRKHPSKIIYLLIPLQMIWANFHEAFGIGLVILFIYTASSWVESRYPSGQKSESKEKKHIQLSLITIGAIAVGAINPNGLKLLASPFNIMSQVYSNKYTTELLNFISPAWWLKEAWIGLFIFVISFMGLFLRASTGSKKEKGLWSISAVLDRKAYLLTILAFLYLGLTAYRNLIFLSLVCFPVFHFSLFVFFKKQFARFPLLKKTSLTTAIVLLFSFYCLVVSNKYYKFTNSRDHFGLEVLSNYNPTGAADFIRQNKLQQKKCFADYLTSSYLLYQLQPDFKTFIDLRDLDVFSPEFFDKFFNAVNDPQQFHKLDNIEHFDYVVLYQGQFPGLHAYLYNDSIYALKYVDAVAAVYEKTDIFSREDIFSQCQTVKPGTLASIVNKVLNPFYDSFDYSDQETDYIAASYYINAGRPELAARRAEKCTENRKIAFKGYELLGNLSYNESLNPNVSKEKKDEMLDAAEQYYLRSLRLKDDYGRSLLALGVIYYSRGNYKTALNYFNKCEHDKEVGEQAKLFGEECVKAMH